MIDPPSKVVLSLGAYEEKSQDAAREHARNLFLQTVRRLYPRVLKDLQDRVDTAQAPVSVVDAWAKRWNLNEPWVIAAANGAIAGWKVSPLSRERCSWCFVSAAILSDDGDTSDALIPPQAWPDEEPEAEYIRRATGYYRRAAKLLRQRGYQPAVAKHPGDFERLAHWQVGELSTTQLLKAAPHLSDRSAIYHSLQRLAQFIGLNLSRTLTNKR